MKPNPQRNLVLSIVAQNENGTLQQGSESLGQILQSKGYRHHIINMLNPSGGSELLGLLQQQEIYFAYAFAGVGSQLSLNNGTNIWTAARTPFVCLWHDHPAYNFKQHRVDSPFILHGYHVRDHLDARLNYLPPSTSKAFLLPVPFGSVANPADCHPITERVQQILYAKTGKNPSLLAEDWKRHPQALQDILWALVEQAQKDRNLDLTSAAAACLRHAGWADNLALLMGIVEEVDDYIRAWRSDRFARALLPHPVQIIGRGWDYLKAETIRAEFNPPVVTSEFFARMPNFSILANTNPLWRDGLHERVMMGMSVGSIILTDRTEKSDQVFGAMPNYVGFEWHDDLEDVIATALKRSEADNAGYFEAARNAVVAASQKKMLCSMPDYVTEIETAVSQLYADNA